MAQPQSYGIRQYLKEKGYNDGDITYNNGAVNLKGKKFMDATPQADGTTYAAPDALKNALAAYNKPTYAMAQTGESGIRPALNGYGIKDDQITYGNGTVFVGGKPFMNATPREDGNTYGANQAIGDAYKAWQNGNRTDNYNNMVDQGLTNYQNLITQPRQAFSYDKNTDPVYKNALADALRNAQTRTDNTLSQLGSRGIANSSVAVDRARQNQFDESNKVETQLLPQLINQAYERYMGEQQLHNQDLSNLQNYVGAVNGLGQQQFQNGITEAGLTGQYNGNRTMQGQALDLQGKEANLNAATQVGNQLGKVLTPQSDWGNLYNQTNAPDNINVTQANADREEKAKQFSAQMGLEYDKLSLEQKQVMAQIANAQADNARSNASLGQSANNANMSRLFEIWDRTGKAPAGIPGVAEGTTLQSKPNSGSNFNLDDYKGFVNNRYFQTNAMGQKAFDSSGARKYILSLHLPDDQTDQLLGAYGLSTK